MRRHVHHKIAFKFAIALLTTYKSLRQLDLAFLGGFARNNMEIEVALIVKWQPSCIRRGEGEGAIRLVGECEGQGGDGGCR